MSKFEWRNWCLIRICPSWSRDEEDVKLKDLNSSSKKGRNDLASMSTVQTRAEEQGKEKNEPHIRGYWI